MIFLIYLLLLKIDQLYFHFYLNKQFLVTKLNLKINLKKLYNYLKLQQNSFINLTLLTLFLKF